MTMQGTPTLNPVAGFSNAPLGSFGAKFPTPLWPGSFYTWFSDFDRFDAVASGKGDWLATLTNTLITGAQVSDAFGGVLSITNTAADDDAFFAQWQGMNASTSGAVAETFTFVAGKELFFACRFQISDATQTDFIIGLAVADTTPLDAADGVYFLKADGAATMALVEKIATPVTSSATVATITAATWVEAAFHYDGIDGVRAYIDGNYAGNVGISALPTTELAVTFGLQNGEAVAKTALIDWIYVARER